MADRRTPDSSLEAFHIATMPDGSELAATAPRMVADSFSARLRSSRINPKLATEATTGLCQTIIGEKIAETEAFIGRPMTRDETLESWLRCGDVTDAWTPEMAR